MPTEQQLQYCKTCNHRKFEGGIICGITNMEPDFQDECEMYDQNELLKKELITNNQKARIDNAIAGNEKRFLNLILDNIFLILYSIAFGFVLASVLFTFFPNSAMYLEQENIIIEYTLGFIIAMIYFVTTETITGKTPAKYITKTKVVDENGNKPDNNTIIIRSLCRFIPFEAVSFIISDRGWHDKFSNTYVVHDKK